MPYLGSGWMHRRLVQVTVAASGVLADVVLDDQTRGQAVATTRVQILEAAQAAHADLARKPREPRLKPLV